jgi:hypothetical protein
LATGSKVDLEEHIALALWAAGCAERALHYFESTQPEDNRPRKAIESLLAWTKGEMKVQEVRVAAFASHAAARAALTPASIAAARAAGQAAGTAHVPEHARHAASYALKAVLAGSGATRAEAECKWQRQHLPKHFSPMWLRTMTPNPLQGLPN